MLTQLQFDDLTTVPEVPLLTPTGEYKQLDFENFEVVQLGVGGLVLIGIIAQSPPNVIGNGLQDSLLQGPPVIKTGKGVKSFDLESFYFGCVLDTAASAASVPPACKLTVNGFDAHGKKIADQDFQFTPKGLKSPMAHAKLSSKFRGLDHVTFSTSTALDALTSTLYDNFSYKVYH